MLRIVLLAAALLAGPAAAADKSAPPPSDKPSRAAFKGCAWERFADPAVSLAAWVQRCDYGFRRIDFVAAGRSLAVRFSDGGVPDPVIDVLDLPPAPTPEAGLKSLFASRAPQAAAHCVLQAYRTGAERKGVKRYTFVPDRVYGKQLEAKADPNDVPEPPCGDLGASADGISYFEWQSAVPKKVLFVRVGQDEPLFDEKTLRVLD